MTKGGKKNKNKDLQTLSLGEFLELDGVSEIPIYKEVPAFSSSSGVQTKMVDISKLPNAPKSSYEVAISPEIISKGPPYPLCVTNIPFDSSEDDLKKFFASSSITSVSILVEGIRSLGCAIVLFSDLNEYKSSLERDGQRIGSRSVVVTQGHKPPESINRDAKFGHYRDRPNFTGSGNRSGRYCSYDENVPSALAGLPWRNSESSVLAGFGGDTDNKRPRQRASQDAWSGSVESPGSNSWRVSSSTDKQMPLVADIFGNKDKQKQPSSSNTQRYSEFPSNFQSSGTDQSDNTWRIKRNADDCSKKQSTAGTPKSQRDSDMISVGNDSKQSVKDEMSSDTMNDAKPLSNNNNEVFSGEKESRVAATLI